MVVASYRKDVPSTRWLEPQSRDKPTSIVLLPYVQTKYGRISRIVGLPLRKLSSFLRPVKDELRLGSAGVYSRLYECGQVYIGQTGRSIKTRIK